MKRGLLVLALATLLMTRVAQAIQPFDPFGEATIVEKPGAQVPLDLPFRDQAGRAVTLRGLGRGRPILLAPVQHRCPNICIATLEGLARAVRAQGARPGQDVEVVAFGIDPREGIGEAALSAQRLEAGLGGPAGVAALTGQPPEVTAVANALGYRYAWDRRIGQYAHVAATAVLSPDGRLSGWLYGVSPRPGIVHAAIATAARGGKASLGERLLLLCYHYDPVSGRYDLLVMDLLRGGVALAALLLAALITLALLRERRARTAAP